MKTEQTLQTIQGAGRWIFACTMAGTVALATIAPTAHADDAAAYKKLMDEKAPALVTVKFVLKLSGRFGDRETDSETTGVMMSADGMLLCSNTQLSGPSRFFGGGSSATPRDIKVLIGDDQEGVEAELIARDTELDLAWIRIKQPREEPYSFIDFAKPKEPALGEKLLMVRRLAKYFDRAPIVAEGTCSGIIEKPRKLFVPGGDFEANFGLPVFDAAGEIVGVTVLQMPTQEGGDINPMQLSGMRDLVIGFILPASEVVKATERAMMVLADEEEEDPAS